MEEIRMNIKNNKNCKITINDEEIAVSEKEKTADELFKELGYEKIRNDKDFEVYRKNDYNIIDCERNDKRVYKSARYDTTSDGITMKELKAINKKVRELRLDMIETETGKVLNKLAREQFKSKLLAEILIDLQVCKLENLNPKEYIEELKQEIDNIYERFNNENE